MAILQNILDEKAEHGGNTHGGDVGSSQDGSVIGGGGGAAAGGGGARARGAVGSGGVAGLSLALVGTVDGVVLPGVEGGAAEVTSALHVESTTNVLERGKSGLVESTAEVNGTGDGGKLGEADGLELVVAGDQETTVDGLQDGKAEVGELGVVLENKVTSFRVAPETELTLELGERRKRDRADVTDGQVGTGGEVGKRDLQLVVVTSEVDQVGGVLEVVHVDGLELSVVGDDEALNRVERNSVEGRETGVDDRDTAGLGDTLGETEALEDGDGLEVNLADRGELREVKRGERSSTIELEGVVNCLKSGCREGGDVRATGAGQGTLDPGNTVDGDRAGQAVGELDITVKSLTGVVAVQVALAADAKTALAAARAGRAYLTKAIAMSLKQSA
ncbi:uncharacterized protein DSM5745_11551 [Aspergillus mulundensis]|uniref:Uncharacterized protein n=1 Tax=Aspergillus mulundensis TaxID=1810919 RepID=A0A3D8Q5R6_9EURO|nr:hypothetical protein DSM5745_11551 [Aspergillus mulundensis]RDW57153.1 hypothetical protein DSM5745_11551 [Aspergillus mulundensis]